VKSAGDIAVAALAGSSSGPHKMTMERMDCHLPLLNQVPC
jgi:hypothetical protein